MTGKGNLSVYIDNDLIEVINSRTTKDYSKSQVVADILRAGLILQENLEENTEATSLFNKGMQTLEDTIKSMHTLRKRNILSLKNSVSSTNR